MKVTLALASGMAGLVLGIVGFLIVGELRAGPRMMPNSEKLAYEKWCGVDLGGTTHYNAQRYITGCTVPGRSK